MLGFRIWILGIFCHTLYIGNFKAPILLTAVRSQADLNGVAFDPDCLASQL